MKKLLLTTILLFPASVIAATPQTALQQLHQRLARHPSLQADFVQKRYLPGIPKALQGHGTITFARGTGFRWHLAHPVQYTIIGHGDSVIRYDASCATDPNSSGGLDPRLTNLLQDVVNGKAESMSKMFDIQMPAGPTGSWQLELSPRPRQMKRWIQSITLAGDDFVQSVTITLTTGDKTEILFQNTHPLSDIVSTKTRWMTCEVE